MSGADQLVWVAMQWKGQKRSTSCESTAVATHIQRQIAIFGKLESRMLYQTVAKMAMGEIENTPDDPSVTIIIAVFTEKYRLKNYLKIGRIIPKILWQ